MQQKPTNTKRNIHKLEKETKPAHQLKLISKSKQKSIIKITISDIILKLLRTIVPTFRVTLKIL